MGLSIENIPSLSPELQQAYKLAVEAENRHIDLQAQRKNYINEKVSLLDDLFSNINGVREMIPELNSPLAIRDLRVSSTDEKALTAIADKNFAAPGNHKLEILRLATPASAMSNGFPDRNSTQIGSGYFLFTTASGDSQELFIDNDNSTLDGIARVINSAALGMKAAVINDGSDPDNPFRLLLTAEGTGKNKNVNYPDFYFVDGEWDFELERETPAKDALIRYEGFEVGSATNDLPDLIPGVMVKLRGITEAGKPETLNIEQDAPKTTVKMGDLIGNVNKVLSFIQSQNRMDENSQTYRTLGGSYSLNMAENRIRRSLYQTAPPSENRKIRIFSDIGIEFNKKGTLDFNEKKFEKALETHYEEVVRLLAGSEGNNGFVRRLDTALNSLTLPGQGVLSVQKRSFQNQAKTIQGRIDRREATALKKIKTLKTTLISAQKASRTGAPTR